MNEYYITYSYTSNGMRITKADWQSAWTAEHAVFELTKKLNMQAVRVESVWICDSDTYEQIEEVHQSEWDCCWDSEHEELEQEISFEKTHTVASAEAFRVFLKGKHIGFVFRSERNNNWVMIPNSKDDHTRGGTRAHAVHRYLTTV